MDDRIKDTFDKVHADEELKNRIRAFLIRETNGYTRYKAFAYRNFVAAAVCLLCITAGGHWLCFIPTAKISIDINPSIELAVNRFDKVVAVDGRNDDGRKLAEFLDIRFTDYEKAIHRIMENERISDLLSNAEIMTIAVTGSDDARCAKILSDIKLCTREQNNTRCYLARPEEAAAAREAGLPYGKYRAFLELQALDPSVTPEIIRGMTMRELCDLISTLSSDDTSVLESEQFRQSGRGKAGYGCGQGAGNCFHTAQPERP